MIAFVTLLLAMLAAPVQQEPPAPAIEPAAEQYDAVLPEGEGAEYAAAVDDHAADAEHAEEEGHGGFDAMHHVLDGRYLEFYPFGVVQLPPAGSWELFGVDFTPTRHVVFLGLTSLLLMAVFIPIGQAAKRRGSGETPRGRRHNIVEAMSLFIRDEIVMPNIGHGGERYVPFLLTLFFFILFANLLGLVPWGATATANIAVTGTLALISLIAIEVAGMRTLGAKGYLGTIVFIPKGLPKLMIPVMAVIMTPVELLGKFAKPFALAVRLMANMTAGHIVLLSLFGMALLFGSLAIAVGPFIMALALMFLELFVAFLQAYVFVMLTAVFIGMIMHAH